MCAPLVCSYTTGNRITSKAFVLVVNWEQEAFSYLEHKCKVSVRDLKNKTKILSIYIYFPYLLLPELQCIYMHHLSADWSLKIDREPLVKCSQTTKGAK